MPERNTASPWRMSVRLVLLLALGGCGAESSSFGEVPRASAPEEAWPEGQIEEQPLPVCATPVASPGALEDRLPGSGISFVHELPAEEELPPGESIGNHMVEVGAGVTVADLNGDGYVDLLFMQTLGPNELYLGRGNGTFELRSGSGLELPQGASVQASAVDFDADGDLDVAITGFDLFHLFRNEGEASFVDVTEELGIGTTPGMGTTTAWADIDGDGDLDLYNGIYGQDSEYETGIVVNSPDGIWRNDGDRFTDVASALPYPGATDGAVLLGLLRDFDEDGDPDLLQVNDLARLGEQSFLWENLGTEGGVPQWVDRLPQSGVGGVDYPMGASVIDIDGDGLRDLFFTNIGRVHSFRGDGLMEWYDTSLAWLPELPADGWLVSWSIVPLDLDGDGRPGLLISYGPLTCPAEDFNPPPPALSDYLLQPDRYLVPVGEGDSFSMVQAPEVFPSPQLGSARAAAVADLNQDGTPDVVLGNLDGPPAVMLGKCTEASRLVVRLRDETGANLSGVGARVMVQAGGRVQFAEVSAGGPGSGASVPPDLLFGLGDATRVDRVEVSWPGGGADVLTDVCAHCTVTISRR